MHDIENEWKIIKRHDKCMNLATFIKEFPNPGKLLHDSGFKEFKEPVCNPKVSVIFYHNNTA